MATSSIGRTTVVDKEHAEVLAKAVREHKARHANDCGKVRIPSISEVHAVGHPISRTRG